MEKEHDERICVCALNRLLGYEPAAAHRLIEAVGTAQDVFRMTSEEKFTVLGPFSKIGRLLNEDELEETEKELQRLEGRGYRFITMSDPGYPELMLECEDAPLGLYYRGCTPPEDVFNTRPGIAVVGTRDITPYGKEWCRKIVGAMALAEHKPLIISGFALGTDITAHLAALEAGLPTVAVLPTGIDDIYPPRHRHYADVLEKTGGCALVTDYPPDTQPKAINFIRRNRIIAGMSRGTILIESKARGGGMITARLAASYDRDLLVLPGRADDSHSQGCNILLREKLAEPVTDTSHFLDILGLGAPSRRRRQSLEQEVTDRYRSQVTPEELKDILMIAGIISRNRGITLDGICPLACLPYGAVARYAGMLESDGIISTDLLQRCSINVKIV